MEKNYAKEQAKNQLDSIIEMTTRLTSRSDTISDRAREEIQEDALEVGTRKDYNGTRGYMILLCTGGPAVRIEGDLNEYDEPETAELQYQDWGTPWTKYYTENANEDKALLLYASQFYFGKEGEE